MEIYQILVFKEIVEKGSIQKAAGALHRTQPALSAALKTLEESLGFQLFDRSEYRLKLTPKGHRFWEGLQPFTQAHNNLLNFADNLREQEVSQLEVAINSAVPFLDIIPALRNAINGFPETRLSLRFGIMNQSLEALSSKDVELAISPLRETNPAWSSHFLLTRKLVTAIPKCLIPKNKKIDADYLRSIPNIIVSTHQNKDPFIHGSLPGGQSFSVSNIAVREQLMMQGFGWGKLPEDRLQLDHIKKVIVPIEVEELAPVPLQFHVVWNKDKKLSQVARLAKDALVKQFAQ